MMPRATTLLLAMTLAIPGASADDADAAARAGWASARARYGAAGWPSSQARAGFELGRFAPKALVPEGAVEASEDGTVSRRYTTPDGQAVLLIELAVEESTALAHDRMIAMLAHVVSQAQPVSIGDAGFLGRSAAAPGRLAWLGFLRGNLVFRLSALQTHLEATPDLEALARVLDRQATASAPLAEGAAVPRPIVDRLVAVPAQTHAGDSVDVQLALRGPSDGVIVSYVVGGPGQGYVEDDGSGRTRLVTTSAGDIHLTARVTSPLGTTTSAELTVPVAPRSR